METWGLFLYPDSAVCDYALLEFLEQDASLPTHGEHCCAF
jgi:hypothetical protein